MDLLDPPRPEEALTGETFIGIDLNDLELDEFLIYLEELEKLHAQYWSIFEVTLTQCNNKTDQVERLLQSDPRIINIREKTKHESVSNRIIKYREKMQVIVQVIDTKKVPCAFLMKWIEDSASWCPPARNDLRYALALQKQISDGIAMWQDMDMPHLCLAGEALDNAPVLYASDGFLSVSDNTSYAEVEHSELGKNGMMTAHRLEDGELLRSNNNGQKWYLRDNLYRVAEASLIYVDTVFLEGSQLGYLYTFMERIVELPELTEASLCDQVEYLNLDNITEGGPNIVIACMSSIGFFDRALVQAAHEAGWTDQEMCNPWIFLQVLKFEGLSKEYNFYNANLHLRQRCAKAPGEEEIIDELGRIRQEVKQLSRKESQYVPKMDDILSELKRKRTEITLVQP